MASLAYYNYSLRLHEAHGRRDIVKKFTLTAISLYASLCGLCLSNVIPVAAATRHSMVAKSITLDGQVISRPQSFVSAGTTYMPIYYVMQALTKLGVQNEWNGSAWNLNTAKTVQIGNPGGSGKNLIEANGHTIYRVNGIVTPDPSSKKYTTYMPVWYVMQVLTDIGVNNTWDGVNWSMTGVSSSQKSASGTTGVSVKLQNQAADDSAFWSRASENLYIMASTDTNFSQTATKPMQGVEPSDPVHLMAYSDTLGIDTEPVWYVNSEAATVTNDSPGDWTYGSYEARSATFTASKPGIYTVQFSLNGTYSVPLVLIVGMNSLGGASIPVQAASSGIQSLPSGLPAVLPETIGNITFYPYRPVSGWLPVSGHVTGTASTMVVDLENEAGNEWTYVLPVQNGVFKGEVRVPFQGNVQVSLVPDFWNVLNQSNGSWSTDTTYSETVTAAAPSELEKALLSSAMMDWNMSSEFNTTASILADNSPSRTTAIAAISNYVSEKVVYDFADYNANKFVWKNSTDTWQNPLGVCEDISELTASMLKSIGIPAETLAGTAPQGSTPDNHEWLRAYNGSNWIVTDPTWNGSGGNVNSSLLNEFMTNTESLSGSRVLDTKESYTWQ
jgi:hypothetical protein